MLTDLCSIPPPQVCAHPGQCGPCHPDQNQAVPTGGGDDGEKRRPVLLPGDEVQVSDGWMFDRATSMTPHQLPVPSCQILMNVTHTVGTRWWST